MITEQSQDHSEFLGDMSAEIMGLYRTLTEENKKKVICFARTILSSGQEASASDLASLTSHTS